MNIDNLSIGVLAVIEENGSLKKAVEQLIKDKESYRNYWMQSNDKVTELQNVILELNEQLKEFNEKK